MRFLMMIAVIATLFALSPMRRDDDMALASRAVGDRLAPALAGAAADPRTLSRLIEEASRSTSEAARAIGR